MLSFLKAALAFGLCFTGWIAEAAQAQTGSIRVEVVASTGPVPGATVSAGGQSAATDASGVATLTLPAGPVSVTATKDGYEPATVRLDVVAGGERHRPRGLDAEGSSARTRYGRRQHAHTAAQSTIRPFLSKYSAAIGSKRTC